MTQLMSSLAYWHGKPTISAVYKHLPEHFIVREHLGYEFSGAGEHLMVLIQKQGENTSFVANELAKYCKVKSKDVGWAGLKDRHAITEQWLSIHLPKQQSVDFSAFEQQYPHIKILTTARHHKKLRAGELQGNFFEITLTQVTDMPSLIERLHKIEQLGVPNYFGAQRFGRDENNLSEARRWGRDKVRTRNQNKRSLYLSTARSAIFNQIVSQRIEQYVFDKVLEGDILQFESPLLVSAENYAEYQTDSKLITAALAGDNALPSKEQALAIEQAIVDAEPNLMALIRGNRMRHDRRNVRLMAKELSWTNDTNNLTLSFYLDSGCFATSILRELTQLIEMERNFET